MTHVITPAVPQPEPMASRVDAKDSTAVPQPDPRTPDEAAGALAAPQFDTKVVVVLAAGLAAWQELNVTAFLASGIATSAPDLVGEPYRDADGTHYLPMLRQPVIVLTADASLLRGMRAKAAARDDIALAVYTRDLFTTSHDAANRAAVAAVPAGALDLVGIALRGPRNAVTRIVKGAAFHA